MYKRDKDKDKDLSEEDYMPMAWRMGGQHGWGSLDDEEIKSAAGEAYVDAVNSYTGQIPWKNYLGIIMRRRIGHDGFRKRRRGVTNMGTKPEFHNYVDEFSVAASTEPSQDQAVLVQSVLRFLAKHLTDAELACYSSRVMHGASFEEIGQNLGLSRQRAHQLFTEASAKVERAKRRL